MAKPIQVAGLSRRTPVARTSTKVLRATLLDLLEKVPEARSGASEKGVHDLRVAVKRFREAFRLFRPILPKKTFRRHRDWIEDLNDAGDRGPLPLGIGDIHDGNEEAGLHVREGLLGQVLPREVDRTAAIEVGLDRRRGTQRPPTTARDRADSR